MSLKRSLLLAGIGLALLAGAAAYWRYARSPDRLLNQARAALDRGDEHHAQALVSVLGSGGSPSHAHFLRGLICERQANEAFREMNQLGRIEGSLPSLGLLLETASGACLPLSGMPQPVLSLPIVFNPGRQRELRARAVAAFTEALAEFRQVEEPALQSEANLHAADAILHLGELGQPIHLEEAVERLVAVVQEHPDDVEAHRRLASIFVDLNAFGEAIHELEQVGRLDPADGRPYRLLGLIYRNTLKEGQAIDAYEEALRRELEPHVRLEVIDELGQLLVEQGYARRAFELIEQTPASFRQSPNGQTLAAEALWNMQRTEEAIRLIDQALQQDPLLLSALRLRARLYLAEEKPQQAIPFLERALRLDPHDYKARHQLVLANEALGKSAEAEEQRRLRDETQGYLRQLTDLAVEASQRPWDESPRLRAAEIWWKLGRGKEARLWLRSAMICAPGDARAQKLLAEMEEKKKS
jgi:tetratricopeptide (TPR) repeat protein